MGSHLAIGRTGRQPQPSAALSGNGFDLIRLGEERGMAAPQPGLTGGKGHGPSQSQLWEREKAWPGPDPAVVGEGKGGEGRGEEAWPSPNLATWREGGVAQLQSCCMVFGVKEFNKGECGHTTIAARFSDLWGVVWARCHGSEGNLNTPCITWITCRMGIMQSIDE